MDVCGGKGSLGSLLYIYDLYISQGWTKPSADERMLLYENLENYFGMFDIEVITTISYRGRMFRGSIRRKINCRKLNTTFST